MYNKKAHIHFVGIGGIGMSGIALILKKQGYTISGCDADCSQKSVLELQQNNCVVNQGNNSERCADPSIDILVYSTAIKSNNTEIIRAQQRGIPTIPRALMLAELMRTKYSIGISGSHGKTTTTSLISHILMLAQYDPTVIVGGHVTNFGSNARLGKSDFLVAEADESDRSFLWLLPTIAVVTNIDYEHVETYSDIDDIKQSFKSFISKVPFYGKAIVCADDKNIQSILPIPAIKITTYGIEMPADFTARNIQLNDDHSLFDVFKKDVFLGTVRLPMAGKHNVANTLAALVVADELEVPFATTRRALASFEGIDRRFSLKGTYLGAQFFDDYGHHPEEIRNTLLVARKRAKQKLTVVFQPHRFTRTAQLWNDFINVFKHSAVDHLIITDIFAASESPQEGVTAQRLAQEMQQEIPHFSITYAPFESTFDSIKKELFPLINTGDLVVMLGAGKVNKLIDYMQ